MGRPSEIARERTEDTALEELSEPFHVLGPVLCAVRVGGFGSDYEEKVVALRRAG